MDIVDEINADEGKKQQNLPEILHICADYTGSVRTVIETMEKCETFSLTADEMDMTRDILRSVNSHGEHMKSRAAWYLVRYGMLIEHMRSDDRSGA